MVVNCAPMPDDALIDTTDDAVLGGRLRLLQPRRGHRFGHDAILLAAACAGRDGDRIVELGAGVGAAGLALAWRVRGARVTLVEVDAELAALAAQNAARNELADRVDVRVLDVRSAAELEDGGLSPGSYDAVLMNPPFNDPGRHRASPESGRRAAHMAAPDGVTAWLTTAARLLRPGGIVTVIYRADGAAELLNEIGRDFGAVRLMPIYPKPKASAIRIIMAAAKASRTPLSILPGLVLADDDGAGTAEAEAVLRNGAALPLAM